MKFQMHLYWQYDIFNGLAYVVYKYINSLQLGKVRLNAIARGMKRMESRSCNPSRYAIRGVYTEYIYSYVHVLVLQF